MTESAGPPLFFESGASWRWVLVGPGTALAMLLIQLWSGLGMQWVVPLAFHLSGCVGDAWLCWAAAHERPGTLIEDLRGGVRVHRLEVRPDRPGADPAS